MINWKPQPPHDPLTLADLIGSSLVIALPICILVLGAIYGYR